jgi:hypothetical protein
MSLRENKAGLDKDLDWLYTAYDRLLHHSSDRRKHILNTAWDKYGVPWVYRYKDSVGKDWARELMRMALEMREFVDVEPVPRDNGEYHKKQVRDFLKWTVGNEWHDEKLDTEMNAVYDEVNDAKGWKTNLEADGSSTG